MYALDIETTPNYDMIEHLPDPVVKTGNTKDEAKILAKVEAAKTKQITNMALSPLTGRVCVVCLYKDNDPLPMSLEKLDDQHEAELLGRVFKFIHKNYDSTKQCFCTWNGHDFDWPFLYKRAALLGVELPNYAITLGSITKRYADKPHIDMMRAIAGWGPADRIALGRVARMVLGDTKKHVDVSEFYSLVKDGKVADIVEYCMHDCKLTYDLWKKFDGYLY